MSEQIKLYRSYVRNSSMAIAIAVTIHDEMFVGSHSVEAGFSVD